MESATRWLQATCVTGAIADGLVGIAMLIPGRMGETEFRYPMGLGASLMFGWTALLLWAYQRPMERCGILLITICPVITGLLATTTWAYASGVVPLQRAIPPWILCVGLIVLFGVSYLKAGSLDRTSVD